MYTGYVDACTRHSVVGWAADTDRPDARLELRVMVNGAEQGRVIADRPREGLRQRGIYGDGAHAFEYAFDPPLSPFRGYNIVVRYADRALTSAAVDFASSRNAARTSACARCWSPPPAAPAPPC